MEQWCTRRICLQNQNSQKNYGRKGRLPSLGTEGLLKLRYINVLKFEKSQINSCSSFFVRSTFAAKASASASLSFSNFVLTLSSRKIAFLPWRSIWPISWKKYEPENIVSLITIRQLYDRGVVLNFDEFETLVPNRSKINKWYRRLERTT